MKKMEHQAPLGHLTRSPRRVASFLILTAVYLLTFAFTMDVSNGFVRAAARQWLTVETAHFYIHFHPRQEKIAAKAAAIAEDVHATVSAELGYNPKDKTHLTLTDTTDMANGFSDPLYYRKIQVYLVYPTQSLSYTAGFDTRSESWLRMVITHEYTHALHLDMNEGLARGIRTVFGNVPVLATPNITASYAFIEGLAVFSETEHSGGGRGQSAYYDMFLRAAALGGRLPELDQILGFYDLDGWWPAGTPYLYGWSLMDFIARKYGEDKLAAIAQEYSKLYRLGIGGAVKKVLGKNLFTVWSEWKDDLAKSYAAQADKIKEAPGGLTQAENLTTDGELHDNLAFSPDGRFLAFAAEGQKHFPGLYLLDRKTGKERKLVSGYVPYSNGLGWFPDGKRLVYAKVDNVDSTRDASDLYLYDLRTKNEVQLTRGLRADGPAVSPGGTKLAYVARDKDDPLETRLFIADLADAVGRADTSTSEEARRIAAAIAEKSTPLWAPGNETQLETPVWSPDGERIALGVWRKGGFQDVALVDVQTGHVSYITQDRSMDRRPAWSPDGRYLVFESDRTGVPNLFAYDLVSGQVVQLTNVLYGAAGPTLVGRGASPDETTEMAFMNYGPSGYDIAVMPFSPAGRPEVALARQELPGTAVQETTAPAGGAEAGGQASLAALGLKARPYNPWSSLMPRYWLPSIGQNERGWEFGVVTSGADAVGERSYSAVVRFSPAALRPAYSLVYQQKFTNPLAPTVSLEFSDQTGVGDIDLDTGEIVSWDRVQIQGAEVRVPFPKMLAGHSLIAGVARKSIRVYDELGSEMSRETRGQLYAGWDYQKAGGSERRSWSLALGTNVNLLLIKSLPPLTYGVTGTGWGELTLGSADKQGRRSSFSVASAVAASTLAGGILVGNQADLFGVRGYSIDTATAGSKAFKLRAQYTIPFATIDRGYGDWPIFLGKLRAAAFVEGAAAWDGGILPAMNQDNILASVGAEVTLDTYLAYIAPLRLGLGVAKPLTGPRAFAVYPVVSVAF